VYNEEVALEHCLKALLSLDYPSECMEILVGSDGSSDHTNSILLGWSERHPQIRPYVFCERRGKIPVVNDLVAAATGEILFFTDADVTLAASSIRKHVRNYADPTVGGVAGNLVLADAERIHTERVRGPLGSEQYYMSIENKLRQYEAELHSTVGIFGGHYSIRRELWNALPNAPICDELFIALTIVQSGKRMIFESEAIAQEYFGRSMADEFKRKTRFASRGMSTLLYFRTLMNPTRGWLAIMLWSHKALRWLTPFCLLGLIVGTVLEAHSGGTASWFQALLIVELAAAILVIAGAGLSRLDRSIPVLPHAYWFVTMNAAFALGAFRFLFKREQKFWSQTKRVQVEVDHSNVVRQEVVHS
jgi:cellulose synthase/poly-beta-1,6-N-acetylglucosamine synthase-like glycosyltransferase